LGVAERKDRQRGERELRIIAAARRIAEREGWTAVTIRRLADEIEYSQPVIYSHFESKEAIVAAVAVEGFREFAERMQEAAARGSTDRAALARVAAAYLNFAQQNAALYEAMFTLPTGLRFAAPETRPELRAAFASLAAVVAPFGGAVELKTETMWASLHGLAELERSGRVRPKAHADRVALLVGWLLGG
jgi:AcrR family transcriptional regulator